MEVSAKIANNQSDAGYVQPHDTSQTQQCNPDIQNLDDVVVENTMAAPIPDLGEKYPRVAMTPSMLAAYAAMRGAANKASGKETGPLQDTLFSGPDRQIDTEPLNFETKLRSSSDSLTPATETLWWDPLVTSSYRPSYDEHVKYAKLRQTEQNQYTGRMSPVLKACDRVVETFDAARLTQEPAGEDFSSGFGYLNNNNDWISHPSGLVKHNPDNHPPVEETSAAEIKAAAENLLREIAWVKSFFPPDCEKNILSEEEYKKIHAAWEKDFEDEYEEYKDHVDPDIRDYGYDREGKFENARITPAQFAMLAVGASKGDRYATEVPIDTDTFANRSRPVPGSRIPVIPNVPPNQYDEDDGGAMSGIFSDDSNPSVQESPRGVNVDFLPSQFGHMLPGALKRFQVLEYEAKHGLALISPAASSSAGSQGQGDTCRNPEGPIVFTDNAIYNELGDEAYFANMNELEILRSRSYQVSVRNERNVEIRKQASERQAFLRLQMCHLRKIIGLVDANSTDAQFRSKDVKSNDSHARFYSAQGRSQPMPDNRGIHAGRTLRHSIGRIEDLSRDSSPISTGKGKTAQKLRRKKGKVSEFLDSEKRQLEASIEQQEEVEQRIIEEIYKITGENEDIEKKKLKMIEILQGNFDLTV